MPRKIVVTGGNGQLGKTLSALCEAGAKPAVLDVAVLDRQQLDITDSIAIASVLGSLKPECIINAAAYTQVDKAESDSERAFAINETGVANLASWVAANGGTLLHVSTDFVFDGKATRPYTADAAAMPVGIYGRSKLAGEQQLRRLLPINSAIVRTSWLYSEYGNNFVKTMLRLMSERDEIGVVNDQVGSPTSTHSLAALLLTMAHRQFQSGIFHWTDGGAVSWYEFALQIQREGLQQGLLTRKIPVRPLTTAEYPTPAGRPAYSVMDRRRTLSRFSCPRTSWEQELARVITGLKQQN